MTDSLDPRLISLSQKKKYLAAFSEDDFRDKVVRPLYLMQGFEHGKDTCGPDEEGKDCYFWMADPIRKRSLCAVQTKRGNLNLGSKARDNVTSAETQLRTALNTVVHDSLTKQKYYPINVVLIASKEINSAARRYITDHLADPRIAFQDANDLIPLIDEHMPEFWNGIDAKKLPYLKNLRNHLKLVSNTIDVSELGIDASSPSPITEESFVQLYLYRYYSKPTRHKGRVEGKLEMEELRVQQLLERREKLILLTGDAGAGKTTALRRLALVLVEKALKSPDDTRLPLVLTALEVANYEHGIAILASGATRSLTPNNVAAFDSDDLVSSFAIFR